jgi:hypothetical protein
MKPNFLRAAAFLILASTVLPLMAERPAHLPQTVGEQFLQGLQFKDFAYLQERVLPDQLPQLALVEALVQAAGWLPSVRELSDFPVLSLGAADKGMAAVFAVADKGSVSLGLVQYAGDWYVDLASVKFIDRNAGGSSLGSLKVSLVKPIDRARAFLEAMIRLDLIQAATFGTESTKAALIALQPVIGLVGRAGAEASETDIKMMSEKVDGERAVVEYRIGAKPTKPLVLVRQGGNWMVDLAPGQTLP